MTNLLASASFLRAEIAAILARYPELEDDDEWRLAVLENETDLHRIIERALDEKLDADEMTEAIKARVASLSERGRRFARKSDAMRDLIKSVMRAAALPKVMLPEATLSVTAGRTSVNVSNVEELPQGYFSTVRKADTQAIKAALERGETIPGAELVTGDAGLTIRTK